MLLQTYYIFFKKHQQLMGTYFCQQNKQRQRSPSRHINEQIYKSSNISFFKQIVNLNTKIYFPCQYLGKGVYGTSIVVFLKQKKQQKLVKKIAKIDWITEEMLFLNNTLIDDLNKQNKFVFIKSIKTQKNKLHLLSQKHNYGNLYSHMKKYKKIQYLGFIQLSIRLILILQKLHENNIIYRSLRPQNIIFVNNRGDFQLSELPFSGVGQYIFHYVGAATYTPPEIYSDKLLNYDKSLDFWMLGVLLYQLLVGHTPFEGANLAQIKQNVLNFHSDQLKFPTQLHVSEDLSDFIIRLLSPDPHNRINFDQIRRHHFFNGQTWDQQRERQNLFNYLINLEDQNVAANRIVFSRHSKLKQFKIEQNKEYFYEDHHIYDIDN